MAVTEKAKQADYHHRLMTVRKLLGPSEVRLGDVPAWLQRRLVKAFGNPLKLRGGLAILNHAVEVHFGGGNFWLDHFVTVDDGQVFVAEPFEVEPSTIALLDTFAERLGVGFRISANSWWQPGKTIRLEFFEREEGEDAEDEADEADERPRPRLPTAEEDRLWNPVDGGPALTGAAGA